MAKRRGNNEGTIIKRKDGRWEGKIIVGYRPDGQPKRRSVYGKTRQEVVEKLHALRSDLYTGVLSDHRGQTLGSFRRTWLDRRSHSLAPTTVRAYRSALDKLARLDRVPLDQVNAFIVEDIYADMRKAGLSARTVQITHSTLFSVIKDAVRWRLLPRNFMEEARPPKQVRAEVKVWTPAEVRRFLDFTRGHRLYALTYLALTTGMRRAELVGLRWTDVVLNEAKDTGMIFIRQNVVSVNGTLMVKEPKTAASKRIIHVADDVVDLLREHRTQQFHNRAVLGAAWSVENVVFASEVGGYMDPNNLSRAFRTLVHQSGVTPVGLHALRHTHACILIKEKFDPKVVSERLGHTNVAFTQTVYQHLYDEQRSQAAIGLRNMLS